MYALCRWPSHHEFAAAGTVRGRVTFGSSRQVDPGLELKSNCHVNVTVMSIFFMESPTSPMMYSEKD